MIEKQRLEELIKQGAMIYKISKETFIAGVSDLLKIDKVPSGLYSQEISDRIGQEPDYDLLFETKEDAEFALKYKRIPRTEYLDLPTWEEFADTTITSFEIKNGICELYKLNNKIIVSKVNGVKGEVLFEKPLTKENYISACKLCLRLFKGE